MYQRYGPAYEITVPYSRLHVINHPRYLEHIQKTNSKNYIRGAFTRNLFGELHRSGIFVADGKEWQVQRKAATRAFSKQNFDRHITKSLHHWLDILMRLLTNLSKTDTEFDFQELMGRFMFCIFLRIAFHEDKLALDVMSDDPESLKSIPKYVEAFEKATHCASFSSFQKNPFQAKQMGTKVVGTPNADFYRQYSIEGAETPFGSLLRSFPERTRSLEMPSICFTSRWTLS